ncbi:MAG TPA: alpha/beta fold hydrolase, partial [Stellaceae bacterium]|nr:alpha/beta fold hydrolase [Stellaceae bacterium]
YVVGSGDGAAVRDHVRGVLPGHLVPSVLVWLERLPVTPSGKVDRGALPAVEGAYARDAVYRGPRDATELTLQQIWRALLPVDDIGIDDNFFELGGHSLLAVSLINRCNRAFGAELPLRVLFERPTIAGLAASLRGHRQPQTFSPLVALQPDGFKPPLFCIHPAGGTVFTYMHLARALAPDQPVYGIQASGLEPGETLAASIDRMAEDYLAAIRAARPHGPYHLLGWSFGGIVAQAIAVKLRRAGETVALLALLDSAAPRPGQAMPDEPALMAALAQVVAMTGGGAAPSGPIETLADLTRAVRDSGLFPADFSEAQTERLLAVYGMTVRLPLSHRPERFDGAALLFAAGENSDPAAVAASWAPFVASIETVTLPCGHERMTAPDAARTIADAIKELIRSEIPEPDETLIAAK